ncbi:MAG TPA: hypothetical protein VMU33_07555 [Burkholderiaceae bacterium]|nr:hypothetical protein [Burkholderiaceae bacterium]
MYFRLPRADASGTTTCLLADLDCGEAVVVDPRGADVPVLAAMLDEHRLRPRFLLRTPSEFGSGHATKSRNIPLGHLGERRGEPDPAAWVVVCRASGSRSGQARRLLMRNGFSRVINAGSWRTLP